MPRPAASPLVVALAAVAVAVSSCGEEDAQLLSGGTAREITANLDTVQRLADEGDCAGAESAALQVSEQVEALGGVDERLKRALRRGAARLSEVVAGCEEEVEAIEPAPAPIEAEEGEAGDKKLEKEEEKLKKQEEKERKEEEKEAGGEGEAGEGSPSLPPQAEGEGEGDGNGNGKGPGGPEGGGTPSGGLSPASPAGGSD